MSAIFISHSSKDHAATEEMQAWLRSKNHQSVFLDFDPADGIPAGHSWEQELYQQLRACRAVIALLSDNWLSSRWCFTEVTQARALGKAIFPIRVADCDAGSVLPDIQHLDLRTNKEEGYGRLEAGLKRAGLDPSDLFHWDSRRPPYPGLLAFQEEDAAIFFGRDDEIRNGLDTLNSLRQLGGARLLMFFGASGSGKSSLVRAGMLPRLRRDADSWLPVKPFRPQEHPLDELALALVDSAPGSDGAGAWQATRATLRAAAERDPPDGSAVTDMVRNLQIARNQREATVLLIIDQAEELFGYGPSNEAERFLHLLRAALDAAGGRLMALATMRSDFLGEFQKHSSAFDLAYATVTVDPMPSRNLSQIIEGPAEVAGVTLGPGLVTALLQDTVTEDALPLLAFTLRALYERDGDDGLLELRDYQDLGGLEGSVRRAADAVIQAAALSEAELQVLRSVFVPALVRINEDGQYARRRAARTELPSQVQPLLQRFVDARLLVSDRNELDQETLEVAHEALLRAWPRLRAWLDEDQDKLRLRETIRHAASEWDGHGREEDWLDHRGGRLEAVETLVQEPRFALQDGSERDYLAACLDRRRREQEQAESEARAEQERREREAKAERDRLELEAQAANEREAAARKITQRTRVGAGIALCLAAGMGVIGYIAYQNAQEADRQRVVAEQNAVEADRQRGVAETRLAQTEIANSRRLANLSEEATNAGDAELGILTALEAMPHAVAGTQAVADTPEAEEALADAIFKYHQATLLHGHGMGVRVADFSLDGQRILTASRDGTARIWDAETGKDLVALEGHEDAIWSAELRSDGLQVLTASDDGSARIWDAVTGAELALLARGGGPVRTARFDADGNRVVTGSEDGGARLWDAGADKEPLVLLGHNGPISAAEFSPDGKLLVTGSDDGNAIVWDTADGSEVAVLTGHDGFIFDAHFNPDGARVVTTSDDGTARIWQAQTGDVIEELRGHERWVTTARFSPDGERVVTTSTDRTARVWDAASGDQLAVLRGHEGAVSSAQFGPDGGLIVTASDDSTARVWDAASGDLRAVLAHEGPVRSARFGPDGQRVVTASDDGTAQLWWCRTFGTFPELLSFAKNLGLAPQP